MKTESIPAEVRNTFAHLAPQLREVLAEVRLRRNATGTEHHKAIDKAIREAGEEALKPIDPLEGVTPLEQAATPTEIASNLQKEVEKNAVVDDDGDKTNGDSPIVHDVVAPAAGPVNHEVPKVPVTVEKVMEAVHPGTEAAEAPIDAQDVDKQHVVDKATLTADNGLAQTNEIAQPKKPHVAPPVKEAKSKRNARTRNAAKNAGNPREAH